MQARDRPVPGRCHAVRLFAGVQRYGPDADGPDAESPEHAVRPDREPVIAPTRGGGPRARACRPAACTTGPAARDVGFRRTPRGISWRTSTPAYESPPMQ